MSVPEKQAVAVSEWARRQGLVRSIRLPLVQKSVLRTLVNRLDATGATWPSYSALATDVGCSVRTAQRAVRELSKVRGLLVVEERLAAPKSGNKTLHLTNVYRVNWSALEAAASTAGGSVRVTPGVASEMPQGGVRVTPEVNQLSYPEEVTKEDPKPPAGAGVGAREGASAGEVPTAEPSSGVRLGIVPAGDEFAAFDPPRAAGAFGLEVGAWVGGVRSVTRQPLTQPRGTPAARLREAIETHCPPEEDRLKFAFRKGAEWARTGPRVISPFKFIEHLDTGTGPRPDVRPVRPVQPFDPSAPWFRGGKTA